LDPQDGRLDQIEDPEAEFPDNRFNDGTVDNLGNFIAGTMHDLERDNTGSVYLLDSEGVVKPLFGGFIVCNGPAFSPDGCTLYFSNSSEREILAFPYDAGIPDVGKPRLFTKITEAHGYPDGLAVDLDGCVWCAHWDGGGVSRFSPQGEFLQFFALPTPRVTSCAFGGSDYEQLYITTASWGLSSVQQQESPLSGSLFVVTPGVKGMPSRAFLG
jgi:sugar lactone lactonase YvrE